MTAWPRGGKQAVLVDFKWEAALLLLVGRQGGNALVRGAAEKQDRKYIKEKVLGVLFTCWDCPAIFCNYFCCFTALLYIALCSQSSLVAGHLCHAPEGKKGEVLLVFCRSKCGRTSAG